MLWTAVRRLHEVGAVAMPPCPYAPAGGIPRHARFRTPYSVTLFYNDDPTHPAQFISFGGEEGRDEAVREVLGAPIEISDEAWKRLHEQLERFLHRGDRSVFRDVRQAAGRLRGFIAFLQFRRQSAGDHLWRQALGVLLPIVKGEMIGFDADFAVHSLAGHLNQHMKDRINYR